MRIPFQLLALVVVTMSLLDWRIYAICRHRSGKRAARIYLGFATAIWIFLLVAVLQPLRSAGDAQLVSIMNLLFIVLTVTIGKLIFVVIDFIACIPRLWKGKRLKAVTWTGLALAIIAVGAMWWGSLINRYRIDVKEVDVEIPGLPEAFDGLRIAQFSDLHVGTYAGDTTFTSKLVDSLNNQKADIIVFTGDIVNRHTQEIVPFIKPLSRLKAPMGVYSILGNHDYGDYFTWPSDSAKRASLQALVDAEKEMGWDILLDEHRYLKKDGDSIAIIGVENIGDAPFPVYGSLARATKGLNPEVKTLLLSHNPVHWTGEVIKSNNPAIDLMLAGHTHAMQIEIGGISPASIRYEKWGGLYTDHSTGRKMYVNIGAGTVGTPMRLGATPEITVITLRRK